MSLIHLLAYPANFACDKLGVTDKNERSVVRMLVNTTLWTTIGVVLVLIFAV